MKSSALMVAKPAKSAKHQESDLPSACTVTKTKANDYSIKHWHLVVENFCLLRTINKEVSDYLKRVNLTIGLCIKGNRVV